MLYGASQAISETTEGNGTRAPVSYTHLDVYKRQVQRKADGYVNNENQLEETVAYRGGVTVGLNPLSER